MDVDIRFTGGDFDSQRIFDVKESQCGKVILVADAVFGIGDRGNEGAVVESQLKQGVFT